MHPCSQENKRQNNKQTQAQALNWDNAFLKLFFSWNTHERDHPKTQWGKVKII